MSKLSKIQEDALHASKAILPKGYAEHAIAVKLPEDQLYAPVSGYWISFPQDKWPEHKSGFRIIPNFWNYSANKDGSVIYDALRKTDLVMGPHPDGYLQCTVKRSDGTSLHTGTHRLTAMAWCINDDPINKNVVDHIKAHKQVNDSANLEWVTQEENAKRRVAQGVAGTNLKCKVKDTKTGEILEFDTIREAAEHIGASLEGMSRAYAADKDKLILKRYLLKLEGDDGIWSDKNVTHAQYFIYRIEGVDEEFRSPREVYEHLNLMNVFSARDVFKRHVIKLGNLGHTLSREATKGLTYAVEVLIRTNGEIHDYGQCGSIFVPDNSSIETPESMTLKIKAANYYEYTTTKDSVSKIAMNITDAYRNMGILDQMTNSKFDRAEIKAGKAGYILTREEKPLPIFKRKITKVTRDETFLFESVNQAAIFLNVSSGPIRRMLAIGRPQALRNFAVRVPCNEQWPEKIERSKFEPRRIKQVFNDGTEVIFDSNGDAHRGTGVKYSTIAKSLEGKPLTYDFKFVYEDD